MKDYRQVVCKFMPESTCKLIPTKSDYNYLRGVKIYLLLYQQFIKEEIYYIFPHISFLSYYFRLSTDLLKSLSKK